MLHLILGRIQWLGIITSFIVLTASCVQTDLSPSTRAGSSGMTPVIITPVVSEPDPLDGTRWELVDFKGQKKSFEIPEQPQPILQFKKGILGLQTGCNEITGYYELGDHNSITITFAEKTEMDCSFLGLRVNEIEEAFYNAMQTFESYSLEDDQLRIHYAEGSILLHRAPVP